MKKENGMMVTTNVEKITPQQAQKYLDSSPGNVRTNLPMKAELARRMLEGEFVMNGEPVIFDEKNTLMDGHTRLGAVVASGVTVQMLVVRGVSRQSAFQTIDTGKQRTVAQILSGRGITSVSGVVAAAGILVAWQRADRSRLRATAFSPDTIMNAIEANPGIHESYKTADRHKKDCPIPSSIVAAMRYITDKSDTELSQEFWSGMEAGVGILESDVRGRWRNMMFAAKVRKRFFRRDTVVLSICRAWNVWYDGRTVMQLRVVSSDAIPELSGVPEEWQYGALATDKARSEAGDS